MAIATIVAAVLLPACGHGARSAMVTGQITWAACDHGFQCASFQAPRDYARPTGPTITVAMARQPAEQPSQRTGVLFVNPGGPGGSAIQFMEEFVGDLPTSITDRFDVIGIDPRGVGRSTPIDCDGGAAALYRVNPALATAAERQALLAASRTFVRTCARIGGSLLAHIGTRDVARDMDRARALMGERQISYLGYSYGTAIGQVYSELFPTRLRAMVLDGVVDLSQSGIASADGQADGFELALRHFATGCQHDPACPIGSDPIRAIDLLDAEVQSHPISSQGVRSAGPGEVALALGDALYDESSWPDLAKAVAQARTGDGTAIVKLADDYLSDGAIAAYFGVSCLDSAWPGATTVLADARAADRRAPHFGDSVVEDYVRCSLWPYAAQPLTPPTGRGVPPIVVVTTTGDPATPYADGVHVAARYPDSMLITHVGEGHTASYEGDTCIDDAVTAYLVSLRATPKSLRCR